MLAALLRHRTTPLLLRSVGSAALPLAMPPAARGPSTPRSEHGFAPARMPPLRQLLPHRRLGGLSSLHTAAERPLIVVLDMDECLVHSTNFSDDASGLRQDEDSRPDLVHVAEAVETFEVAMEEFDDWTRKTKSVTYTVHKRPGLDAFLAACADEFQTYVFTAGTQPYAEPLLDTLDPQRELLQGRLYRDHCREVVLSSGSYQYLKDLRAALEMAGVDEEDFSRVVLVDNNPMSFVCQPSNGIPVPDFTGKPDQCAPTPTIFPRGVRSPSACASGFWTRCSVSCGSCRRWMTCGRG